MAIRVTKPITKYGRYYAAGELITEPSGLEWSMCRLYGWEQVDDPKPVSELLKPELVQLAKDGGLYEDGMSKPELIEALS